MYKKSAFSYSHSTSINKLKLDISISLVISQSVTEVLPYRPSVTFETAKTFSDLKKNMDSTQENRLTAQEKHYFYNTLAVLIKAVVGHKTTVDLRNETTIYGKIEHADA